MIARSAWASARGEASGVSASGRPSASTMNACASSSSGNALASQAPQTTPPAAPEKPTRCSRSPQDAQPASCGAKPAASSSFRRKASELARPAAGGLAVEQRELVGEQVIDAGVRVAVVEDARYGLAGAGGAVERAAVLAQARVGGEGFGRGDGQQVAASLIEHEVEPEERLEPAAEARACALRTPLAIALSRPRVGVYKWRIRSASPYRMERRTIPSVFTDPDIALYFLKS